VAQPAGIVQLLESTADAAFAVDARGIVRIWNTAASTLFGWRDADIVGLDWTKVLNGRGALGTSIGREVCDMALAGHTLPAFDAELRSRDGRRRWVRISTLVHAPPRSHTRLIVFIAQDVHLRRTREHLVERMLAAADRLRALDSDGARPAPVSPLTAQEKRILQLFAQGSASAAAARTLGISPHTLRNHLHHINRKLRTHSRLEAVTHAIKRKLI
jgi:PAS domain S-box-containing protein